MRRVVEAAVGDFKMSHTMELLERVVEARLRSEMNICE